MSCGSLLLLLLLLLLAVPWYVMRTCKYVIQGRAKITKVKNTRYAERPSHAVRRQLGSQKSTLEHGQMQL
jgi:hypothetical protein